MFIPLKIVRKMRNRLDCMVVKILRKTPNMFKMRNMSVKFQLKYSWLFHMKILHNMRACSFLSNLKERVSKWCKWYLNSDTLFLLRLYKSFECLCLIPPFLSWISLITFKLGDVLQQKVCTCSTYKFAIILENSLR